METDAYVPGLELLRPLPILGLALMLCNDHLWTEVLPSSWTGKLSDVGFMLYAPAMVSALLGVGLCAVMGLAMRGQGPPAVVVRVQWWLALAIVAIVFAVANLWQPVADWYVWVLTWLDVGCWAHGYHYVADLSDLWVLVLLPLAWWDGRRLAARHCGCWRQ